MRGSTCGWQESKKMGRSNDQAFLKDEYKNCLGNREEKNLPGGCDGIAEIQRESCDFIRALGAAAGHVQDREKRRGRLQSRPGHFKST